MRGLAKLRCVNALKRSAVLLDLDGTLTDPFPGIAASIEYALARLDLPSPGVDRLREWVGPPLLESFTAYFETMGCAADARAAVTFYRERYSETGLYENAVYEGVPAALERLGRNGHRRLLATAKPRVFAQRIIRHFGLEASLDGCFGSELDGTRADKVDLLQYIVEQAGLHAPGCAMVGDRHHDMQAACHHGMRAIGVAWGFGTREELLGAGAEVILDSPGALPAAIAAGA